MRSPKAWPRAGLWVAAIAASAALGLGLVVVFRGGGQDTSGQGATNACDRPLPALVPGPVAQQDFDKAQTGMEKTITLLGQGDMDGARDAFYIQVHGFTHNVDGPLRAQDDSLAKKLCRTVVQLEADFGFREDATTTGEHARGVRDLLRQAATELGFRA